MMVRWHTEQPAKSRALRWSGMTAATILAGGIWRREFQKTAQKLLH